MTPALEFHPRLVEEAVWLALGPHTTGAFHRDRERLYDGRDSEARERAFSAFYASWFERLDLAAPVRQILAEHQDVLSRADRLLFGPATTEKREAAELYVAGSGRRTVVFTLRPRTLVDRDDAVPFLRRELLHVADMLDPDFGYEPRLPRHEVGPAHEQRLQDRYRILWSCSVDGRLVRLGRLPGNTRDARLQEFRIFFACLSDHVENSFERIWSGPRPRHPEIVALASRPEAGFGAPFSEWSGGRCPLCGFPAASLERDRGALSREARGAIAAEFPAWIAGQGICPQCADLYRARLDPVPS